MAYGLLSTGSDSSAIKLRTFIRDDKSDGWTDRSAMKLNNLTDD
jgi:hypothetical protein